MLASSGTSSPPPPPPPPPPSSAVNGLGTQQQQQQPQQEHLKQFTHQMAELVNSWSRSQAALSSSSPSALDPRFRAAAAMAAAAAAAFQRPPLPPPQQPAPIAMLQQQQQRHHLHQQQQFNYEMLRDFHSNRAAAVAAAAAAAAASKDPKQLSVTIFRCSVPNCSCERFQPREKKPRFCDRCKHGWIAHALDKLGLSQFYSTSSLPGCVEAVSPNIVFDVASLVLYGTHAIPVRLKILLDRLFSVLREEEVAQILKGYGWTLEDYQRGYILKDHRGTPLDRWTMCSKEEEPLVLQQFLRFGETRPITQQLLLQEFAERNSEEQRAKAQTEIKRLIERHAAAAAVAAASIPQQQQQQQLMSPSHNGGMHHHHHDSSRSPPLPSVRRPSPQPPPSSCSSPPKSPPVTPVNGGGGASSPLNRLQNMQPYDYRTKEMGGSAEMAAMAAMQQQQQQQQQQRLAIERPVPPTMSPMRMPPMGGGNALGMPLLPTVSTPSSLASYHTAMQNLASKAKREKAELGSPGSGGSGSSSALNLSRENNDPSQSSTRKKSHNPHAMEDGIQQEMKKKLRDNIGISYVSPTTGKKRVQCNVCLKTFCDKGALKIHFSAVHLREMHKCSVDGCNMMFSSRRSRNRHSANPNPKLHTPHLRRKISPHDGRTHQGPYLPGLAALSGQIKDTSFLGSMHQELQQMQRHQMELHRLHELKMSAAFYGQQQQQQQHKRGKDDFESEFKRARMSDSDNENNKNDDDKSLGEHSGKDEVSSGTHSTFGGRKRKSQNPTRITAAAATVQHRDEMEMEEEDFSSDDDDEGFENPLDDNDDELDDDDDDDNEEDPRMGGGGAGGLGGRGHHSEEGGSKEEESKDEEDDFKGNNGEGQKSPTNHEEEAAKERNNNSDSESAAADSDTGNNIPLDKENPRRCVECSLEFPNHFAVKTHYQDVHLKLMHKCTVEGCNAGFPSKRSRDRHSSNLNLHRKLLSTSISPSAAATAATSPNEKSDFAKNSSDFLARLYANGGCGSDNLVANFMKESSSFSLFPRFSGMNFGNAAAAAMLSQATQQGNGLLMAEVGNQS